MLVPHSLLDKLAHSAHVQALKCLEINAELSVDMMREIPAVLNEGISMPLIERLLEAYRFQQPLSVVTVRANGSTWPNLSCQHIPAKRKTAWSHANRLKAQVGAALKRDAETQIG